MEWKDVAKVVGGAAPILGTLLGGPGGAAVGALIASALGAGNTPDEVSQALVTNPDAAVKLKEIESRRQVDLQTLLVQAEGNRLSADTAAIQAVNATMQAEAKSEHWLQWSWRPLNGYALAIGSLATVFAVLYLSYIAVVMKDANALLTIPTIVTSITMALGVPGAVCGVTAWFRGKEKLAVSTL
jgi:hypothetical protein